MSKTVEFKFSPYDEVSTPFGTKGIVSLAAIDESGVKSYYVKMESTSNWWDENQIKEWKASCVREGENVQASS